MKNMVVRKECPHCGGRIREFTWHEMASGMKMCGYCGKFVSKETWDKLPVHVMGTDIV
jgi:hypothetical protein